jgi:hypothetical protein
VRALLWTLLGWSVWVQLATVVAGTIGEVAALASVRSDCVGAFGHCGVGHDSLASVRSVGVGSTSQCDGGHNR